MSTDIFFQNIEAALQRKLDRLTTRKAQLEAEEGGGAAVAAAVAQLDTFIARVQTRLTAAQAANADP